MKPSLQLKKGLTILFGLFLIFSGISHFRKPDMYFPFIPDFLPQHIINYVAGIIEIILGFGVFVPKVKAHATFGILLLMIVFLPLHIADVFKETPAIKSHQLAFIRLPIQLVLIVWAWFIHKQ